ncbi:SagB-type dehydrogenase family enzyme [Hydrogenispora ethanolica]|uniref:SagB-type dehydrogenase family enzyme n=1 Tax=Hydrogenispora ethanolica TaxID=1082276 RepID=A0A4R1RK11_HYDET|nr:nitroreductase family protein [Hydrogenispora ethanolica]TCL66511.1 SagB-type dehydrogenase family enzyme [Hydrogenispora ethanolica]
MTKDLIDAIQERHSIRAYETTAIPDATIGRLLESAHLAPSAGNLQPWKFVVVRNATLRQALAEAAFGQDFIAAAPVNIVVCAEPERSAARYGERGAGLYCLQDTAAATQNILLTATAYGLGSCWVGAFDEAKVRQTLGIGPELRPTAIIPLGYPAEEPEEVAYRSIDEVTLIM